MYILQSMPEYSAIIMSGPDDFPDMRRDEKLERWKNKEPDTIGRFGCLVVSLLNCYNSFHTHDLGLEDFVRELRIRKGFRIFEDKFCAYGTESYVVWNAVVEILKLKEIKFYQSLDRIEIENPNKFYICRVPYDPSRKLFSGHYNMIVSKTENIVHRDSDTGNYRVDWGPYPDYFVHEIIF